jgi:hypothetical protein
MSRENQQTSALDRSFLYGGELYQEQRAQLELLYLALNLLQQNGFKSFVSKN